MAAFFAQFIIRRDDVDGYQVVQRRDGTVTLCLVARNRSAALEQQIRHWIQSRTDGKLNIEFEYVVSIAASPSGKRLLVVNEGEASDE